MIQYCTLCANVGWTGIGTPQELTDCANKYPELSGWSDNTFCNIGGTENDCKALGAG